MFVDLGCDRTGVQTCEEVDSALAVCTVEPAEFFNSWIVSASASMVPDLFLQRRHISSAGICGRLGTRNTLYSSLASICA
ncbi:hypothetical protein Cenrod_1554 [Candidatus Symbiobacter mobilis CR]|uniref:Uncharacterized protein n=1 Tax=Candidatus Symbiobacter mobilis CR TaxID=946483 RepID=U5NBT0_9BURK|nr:hypothetical protein Cenrod_1554 [Candidatus Symbiobacter mobilis CR]